MKITDIKKKEGKVTEFILTLEEGTEIRLLPDTYFSHDLSEGSEWEIGFLKELEDEDMTVRAKNEILRMLDYRMRTTGEVREKLRKSGYREDIAEKSIEEIKRYGYLDDEKYTDMYIKEKVRSSGRNRIINDLWKKGLDRNTVDEIFTNGFEDDERSSCEEAAKKKYRQLKERSDDRSQLRMKLYRFLISRGYGYDLVKSVCTGIIGSEETDDM